MILSIILVILFLSVLVLIHELGHFLAGKYFGLWVEEFGIGLPPRAWGKKIGETIYSVNWLPFGGFVKIFGENREGESEGQIEGRNSFSSLSVSKRAVILFAGVLMNFLLGWFLISLIFAIGIPQSILVSDVQAVSPAAEAGLLAGDKVKGVKLEEEFFRELNLADFTDFVKSNAGREVVVQIERDNKIKEFKIVPRMNPPAGQGALGVLLVESGVPRSSNLFRSLWEGLKASWEIVRLMFQFLGQLLFRIISGQKVDFSQFTGPVGITKITAEVGTLGILYLLQFFSFISLNLAVLNILPIPALDGGRLLFLAVEKIKGSPLPRKFEKYANAAGMAILLTLMVLITIKDIARLFS